MWLALVSLGNQWAKMDQSQNSTDVWVAAPAFAVLALGLFLISRTSLIKN